MAQTKTGSAVGTSANARTTSSVSVVICTYNRAGLLRQTLVALRACTAPRDCTVEIVVVDNNSTDDTASVVALLASHPGFPICYALERQQGKGFALNRALTLVSGDIVALTDDDVLPAVDWLVRIVDAFRRDPIVFTFGKVLPRWGVPPPPELLTFRARDIWGPLALVDYGDQAVRYSTDRFRNLRMPIGANLAVRRDALERIGGWRTDLGRVDNSPICGEDRELCVRLFRAGLYEGLYDPCISVRHAVPAGRLTRRYFRRWYFWHGRTLARMAESCFIDLNLDHVPHVARVPRFVYRDLLHRANQYLRSHTRKDAFDSLVQELLFLQCVGFLVECWWPYRKVPWTS